MMVNATHTPFDAQELSRRIENARAAARAQGLAALVVVDSDSIVEGGTVRYLTNFFNAVDAALLSVLVDTLDADPTLVIGAGFADCQIALARRRSPVPNVKANVGSGSPRDWDASIAEALAEGGFSEGKLGIDGMRFLPYTTIEGLRRALPRVELVDVSGLVHKAALARSAAEEPYIREAARVSKVGMDAFLEAAKPGVRQADAVALCEHAARMAGAELVGLYMSAGEPWVWGHQRHDLVFEDDDIVALEVNARYEGYYGQVCRTAAVGGTSAEKLRIRDAAKAAHEKMLTLVRPGVTPKELYAAGLAVAQSYGFDYSGVRFGHGLGMTIGEGFSITATDDTVIPENAYMVMHPLLIRAETGACGIWGDQLLVRADGPELLTSD